MEAADTACGPAQEVPECVAGLRQAVVGFTNGMGVPDPTSADVRLTVSEAVSNAVGHGFGDGTPAGPAQVATRRRRRALRVMVADDGVGSISTSENLGSGFGHLLMDVLTNRLEIRAHHPRVTEIHLSLDLSSNGGPGTRPFLIGDAA